MAAVLQVVARVIVIEVVVTFIVPTETVIVIAVVVTVMALAYVNHGRALLASDGNFADLHRRGEYLFGLAREPAHRVPWLPGLGSKGTDSPSASVRCPLSARSQGDRPESVVTLTFASRNPSTCAGSSGRTSSQSECCRAASLLANVPPMTRSEAAASSEHVNCPSATTTW